MNDLRQTSEYAKFMQNIGWFAERSSGNFVYIKRFPLIGSFIKIQRPQSLDFNQINRLAKKYRAFQIVIEPKSKNIISSIKYKGFRQCKTPFVPSKTIHIDLSKSEKQLLSEMHYKTRYNIKKINHQPLTINYSKDIENFADFWQKCALKQRGMFLSQKKEIIQLFKAFGRKAHIIECYKNKNLLSGILLIQTKNIAYYMYAASSSMGKKLFAPTLNVWEAIKLAKKLDCKIFDFEGIYDERFPLNSWKGFTRFKKSFGGSEIEYPGSCYKLRLPI